MIEETFPHVRIDYEHKHSIELVEGLRTDLQHENLELWQSVQGQCRHCGKPVEVRQKFLIALRALSREPYEMMHRAVKSMMQRTNDARYALEVSMSNLRLVKETLQQTREQTAPLIDWAHSIERE